MFCVQPAGPTRYQAGCAALEVMDKHLAALDFMCGSEPTLADVALFP
ncbi:MAG: glutathione S-transferase C-terminal domain-containing protein, partial [Pseudomonadota bacterium]